jgi:acetyl-CoA carboxylase carboxyl transferase subunit alpha
MKLQPLEFEKPIVELEEKLADLKKHSRANDINFDNEVLRMEGKIEETKRAIYENLTAWQRVQIARHNARPFALDYLQLSFSNFIELHGDRLFAEDRAMPGGFATVAGRKCVVIGHQKGRELKENIKRNFGCANPEGYRKALRLMRLAE